ncbi:MAG TPA: VWA domain-containing protein [Thermoanaerobaculia bacterium]|jgi:VWFA-related protein
MRNVLVALALSISATASAQVSETIEVRVTNIDVVVTDRAGNPVHGLTADDFEIIEAGKPQAVTNFYEVRGTPAAEPAVAGQPEPPAADPAIPQARRRIVVFIDNTSVHPHARKDMLQTFEKSLDRLMRDGDQAMLVMYDGGGTQVLAPLSADRPSLVAKLREAASRSGGSFAMDAQKNTILENAQMLLNNAEKDLEKGRYYSGQGTPGESTSGTPGGQTRVENKLTIEQAYSMSRTAASSFVDQVYRNQRSVLQQLVQTIDIVSTAEGKKVLVYLGGELSDNPGAEVFQRIDSMYAQHNRGAVTGANRDGSRSLRTDIQTLSQRANAAGVTMYLIDASNKRGNDAAEGTLSRAEPEMMTANDTALTMNEVAVATGGVMMPGGKQFQTALDTIVRDLSSYYSLGYRAQSPRSGRIEVRVKNRPGVRVRTRQSFTAPATRIAEVSAPAAPGAAVVPPAPASAGNVPEATDDLVRTRLLASVHDNDVRGDFPISVTASTPQPQGNGRSQTDLTITFPSTMTLVEDEGSLKGRVAVYLVTSNQDGRTSKVSTDVKELKFPLGTRSQVEAQKTFTFKVPLLIGEGPVNVSVAVADQLAGTSGFAKTRIDTK